MYWRDSWLKRLQVAVIAKTVYPLVSMFGSTLRWRVEGLEYLDRISDGGRQPVMAFWHGRIFGATYYFRGQSIVVITSENFDGEWIARIIQRFGYLTARGSTSRRGRHALRELRRHAESGHKTGFAVDGPRGPARLVQPGVVWLAKVTGNPILPFHVEAAKPWTIKSWDRTQIPKPYSMMALSIGEPIEVPKDANGLLIEQLQEKLERSLQDLEQRATVMLDG